MHAFRLLKWPGRRHLFSPLTLALFIISSIFLSAQTSLHAAQVTLAWDANTEPVAGYRLHYGHASRDYQSSVDVGNTTRYTWSGLLDGKTYYFAATAYDASGNTSDYSEELVCHTIVPSAGTGGSILPASTVFVKSGGSQTFQIVPQPGFQVADVLVGNVSMGRQTSHTFLAVDAPQTITASFVPISLTYSITAGVTSIGGSINPSGITTVAAGGTQAYTITANDGYRIQNVVVNGVSQGPISAYTFSSVAGDGSITASFAPRTYTITASVSGSGGSITPSGSTQVSPGGSQTYTISAQDGYRIQDVLVNKVSQGPVSSYTFSSVAGDGSITASFAPRTYTITASVSGSGGSITPSGSTQVSPGGSQTYTISAQDGYRIQDVLVNKVSQGPVSSYTFSSVAGDGSITASFAPRAYTITASVSGSGGGITPSGSTQVSHGGSQTYTITPAANHQIERLLVDDVPVTPSRTYTFSSVTGNHAITVSFASALASPFADAGPDQTVAGGSIVTLRGGNSTGSGIGALSYRWEQLDGKGVKLSSTTAANPTFKAPTVGSRTMSLAFRLTVTDGSQTASSDICIVNVGAAKAPPVAHAGADQTVGEWTNVTLNGSQSRDQDGSIAAYSWRQTGGQPVQLAGADQAAAAFVAPPLASSGASLAFELTVTDNSGMRATDKVIVNVTWAEEPPVAFAGADAGVFEGDVVVMDGYGSSDDDGIASYRWKQLTGTPANLLDPTAPTLQFTAPAIPGSSEALAFSLTVTDASGLQSEDTCMVTIKKKAGVDLTAAWLSSSYDGSSFRSTLQLANRGSSKSGSFKVTFYLSGDGATKSKPLKTTTVRTVPSAGTRNLMLSYRNKNLAGQAIIAEIDSNREIQELDEDNNTASYPVQQTVFRVAGR